MTAPALSRATRAPSLPAFSPVIESLPYLPHSAPIFGNYTASLTDTGLQIHRSGLLVCWIVCGNHTGQQDNLPKRCDFVDVAYYRTTQRGVNLETADFDTLPEALAFVAEVLGGEL